MFILITEFFGACLDCILPSPSCYSGPASGVSEAEAWGLELSSSAAPGRRTFQTSSSMQMLVKHLQEPPKSSEKEL